DLLAGAVGRRFWCDPARFPSFVNDGSLEVLDRYRRLDDAENAGTFTRSGANPAGEFGEVVRLVEAVQCFLPASAVDEVIPFRNEVVDRAATGHAADQQAGMAERRTAVHAARALLPQMFFRGVFLELIPVLDALGRIPFGHGAALNFHKTGCFSHVVILLRVMVGPLPQLPPTRARSFMFASKAAIAASSPLRPCS